MSMTRETFRLATVIMVAVTILVACLFVLYEMAYISAD